MTGWVETYRGWVEPADCDITEHMTISSYFAKYGDATLAIFESLGVGTDYRVQDRRAFPTLQCHAMFNEELRVGDILHVESALVKRRGKIAVLGNKMINSATGKTVATLYQTVVNMDMDSRRALDIPDALGARLDARLVDWDGPDPVSRDFPDGLAGMLPSGRNTVQPDELDVLGHVTFSRYIRRFSAANMHVMTAVGFSAEYMASQRRGISTFELDVRFLNELHVGDLVMVDSTLADVGRSSFRLVHKMTNVRTGELAAQMSQYSVHLDLDARRPVALPDDIRERAKALIAARAAS